MCEIIQALNTGCDSLVYVGHELVDSIGRDCAFRRWFDHACFFEDAQRIPDFVFGVAGRIGQLDDTDRFASLSTDRSIRASSIIRERIRCASTTVLQ